MGFFKSTKGSIISDYFLLVEDIAHLKANNMYDVALYSEYLEIKNLLGSVKLKYEQITDVYYGTQEEIIKKDKSVIGRAIVGKVFLGDKAGLVGAISGVGEKTKKIKHQMLIIRFKDSENQDKLLTFRDTRLYKGFKIAKKLEEFCKLPKIENKEFL